LVNREDIQYLEADRELIARLGERWGPWAAEHCTAENGFTIVAVASGEPVGFIGAWMKPLPPSQEGFINVIEVAPEFRRRGVARRMIELCEARAGQLGACPLRAWSSEDKTEAIPMWKALGFGLCPAEEEFKGQKVRGYYAAKWLGPAGEGAR